MQVGELHMSWLQVTVSRRKTACAVGCSLNIMSYADSAKRGPGSLNAKLVLPPSMQSALVFQSLLEDMYGAVLSVWTVDFDERDCQ